MELWQYLWITLWHAGLGVFTILAVLITYHGAKDILHLLRSLVQHHRMEEEEPQTAE